MKNLYIPDSNGLNKSTAVNATTTLSISAHQDDIEIMAVKGILDSFGNPDSWFGAVIVADGAGSPRDDIYADYSDTEMMEIRKTEQKKASYIGEYSFLSMLDFTSKDIKDFSNDKITEEICETIQKSSPKIIYTHNLFDKHDTHVAVAMRVISAINMLPPNKHPKKLYGCEVWRGLDWLLDEDKTVFDVSAHENISNALISVFDSQICGGKRYDLATAGRRKANATYYASHGTDKMEQASIAIDMTDIITGKISPTDFTNKYLDNFKTDVQNKLKRFSK